jgi:hypothetical protein
MMTDDTIIPAAAGDLSLPGAQVVPEAPPISMQAAADMKAAFLADKAKMNLLMQGDVNVTAEWKLITQNLWQAPAIIGPRDQAVEDLNESTGHSLPQDILDEYRRNDPVSPETLRMANARWDSLIRDPDFIARFNRKEPEAMKQWGAICSIRSRPVRDQNTKGEN